MLSLDTVLPWENESEYDALLDALTESQPSASSRSMTARVCLLLLLFGLPLGLPDCPALNVIRLFLSCSLQLQWEDTRLSILPILAVVLITDNIFINSKCMNR